MSELFKALSQAQGEFKSIPKNKTVTKKGKDKYDKWFEYQYKYADLDSIIEHTRAPLTKYGLSFTQSIENEQCITTINHASGLSINSYCPIRFESNDMQKIGAAITYAKRYGLSLALGISTDDDLDANDITDEPFKIESKNAQKQPINDVKSGASKPAQDHQINVSGAESSQNQPTPPSSTAYDLTPRQYSLTEKQLKRFYAIAKSKNWHPAYADAYVMKHFNKKPKELSRIEYDSVCQIFSELECTDHQKEELKDFTTGPNFSEKLKEAKKQTYVDHTSPPGWVSEEIPF